MRRLVTASLAVLLPIVSAAACTSGLKRYECAPPAFAADVDAHAIWRCHREIIQRVTRNRRFTLREFREAASFFEALTSIPASPQPSHYGPLPGDELRQRLGQWDEWYEQHRSRLYWDARARQVRTRDD